MVQEVPNFCRKISVQNQRAIPTTILSSVEFLRKARQSTIRFANFSDDSLTIYLQKFIYRREMVQTIVGFGEIFKFQKNDSHNVVIFLYFFSARTSPIIWAILFKILTISPT